MGSGNFGLFKYLAATAEAKRSMNRYTHASATRTTHNKLYAHPSLASFTSNPQKNGKKRNLTFGGTGNCRHIRIYLRTTHLSGNVLEPRLARIADLDS
jgi:hypothetical protein